MLALLMRSVPDVIAAIAAFAYGERAAILDGNVKRVLTRYHGISGFPGLPAIEKQLWAQAQAHVAQVPAGRMADYTQAQMDFLKLQRCDEIQGYLLGRPMPAAQFAAQFSGTALFMLS